MRARWYWTIPAVVILCLLAPVLLSDRTFSTDWGNHYWLIYMQGLDISHLHEPSYYLQSTLGAFYPYYAFYGGTFYVVAGTISSAISPDVAAAAVYLGALAASYLGWTWLAKQAGVRGWRAQLPGAIAVTAPFAVTNLYGRGGIPEVVATAMLPLIAAAAISLVREPRARLRDMAAFVVGIVFLTGTHTLSLVWGSCFLALVTVLLVVCYWSALKDRVMRLVGLAWLGVLGACINAWVLAPLILYHGRLMEQDPDPISQGAYTNPGNLFSLFRNAGDPYVFPIKADINAALPVLALLWALVCGAVFWRWLAPRSRALAAGLTTLLLALVVLILNPGMIEKLPEALRFVQFPYRLVTYADLCIVGLVTLALAALERTEERTRTRLATYALAAIAAFNLVLSVVQNQEVRSWLGGGRGEALSSAVQPPPTWYATLQFADGSTPEVAPTLHRQLIVPVEEGIRDSYRVTYPPGPAGTVQTNIATGSYLVDLRGAAAAGRGPAGQMVVRLPASPDRPRVVEVSAEDGPAVTVARWISLLSLLGACAALVAFAAVRRRRGA
ncbi:MAG TPA: hypothetical protein VGW80_09130 [Solirubrobacterales bacterium]|jgi:hypothetical protein|nr:hypothetical protein [Solirubrobacterales bacterium]